MLLGLECLHRNGGIHGRLEAGDVHLKESGHLCVDLSRMLKEGIPDRDLSFECMGTNDVHPPF